MAGDRALPLSHTTLPTPLSKAGLGIGGRLFLTRKGNTTSRKKVRELESCTGIAPSPPQETKKKPPLNLIAQVTPGHQASTLLQTFQEIQTASLGTPSGLGPSCCAILPVLPFLQPPLLFTDK